MTAPAGVLPADAEMKIEALGSDELITVIEKALDGNVRLYKTFRLAFFADGEEVVPDGALTVEAKGAMIGETGFAAVLIHDELLNTSVVWASAVAEGRADILFDVDSRIFTIAQTKELAELTEEPLDALFARLPEQEFHEELDGLLIDVLAPVGAFPKGTVMAVKPVETEEVRTSVEDAFDEDTEVISIKAVDITF